MWRATFINKFGLEFTADENEPGVESMLEFIKYSTEHGSILVKLEKMS